MQCHLIKVILCAIPSFPTTPVVWLTELSGAGAGQAIEDGYILGKALHDYLKLSAEDLSGWMNTYQILRLPRAQRAQRTSREAGELYELQGEGMRGKTFDECMPELRNRLKDRMNWVWTEDIDAMYEQVLAESAERREVRVDGDKGASTS